jgi:apolipoprotein N-acyltransferase
MITGVLSSVVAIAATVGYGMFEIESGPAIAEVAATDDNPDVMPSTRIALIQSSLDTILVPPPGADPEEKHRRDFTHRMELTHRARLTDQEIDLVVWPESSFPTPDLLSVEDADNRAEAYASAIRAYYEKAVNNVSQFEPVPLIAGTTTYDLTNESVYNSAVLVNDAGKVSSRYFKNHRVMIGEYTPILEYFPEILKAVPFLRSLNAGEESCVMDSEAVAIVPNICFETTVPHFLRNQLNELAENGREPDVMLNITNDGWFFGSTCLDLHFACNVFRAVEMRKPMLVCANTGFSAQIAANGQIIQKGPRRAADFLICEVKKTGSPRISIYRRWGNWIPFAMGWASVIALLVAGLKREPIS